MQAQNNHNHNNNCNVAIRVIDGVTVTPAEARALIFRLKAQLKEAAWKTASMPSVAQVNVAKQMFDSAENGSVFTVHIMDENDLYEIKTALKVESRSIVPVIGALMDFHKSNESLNILISDRVMGDSAYMRYTNQFAQQVSKTTQEFLKVRCIHNSERGIMGVFCRKTEFDVSVTFKGQLIAALRANGEATFNCVDIPGTYLDYPSMLLYTLRKKMPDHEIALKRTKQSFKFTAKSLQK
jgi:hypothetical protein